jgi:hypothetical protein
MSIDDEILRRWQANAAAAGVRLTEEDVARIVERGLLDRVQQVEAIVERAGARETAPDYLAILAAETGERRDG